ncbi:hypothetical protein MTO96_023052 [Rhipicephalus appendiculatus]
MKQLALLALFCAVAAAVDFETYCRPTYDRGPCKAYLPRWWFNVNSGRCEKFIYGGCQGNKNNYQTKKDCETSCLRRQLSLLEVSETTDRFPYGEPEPWRQETSEYSAVRLNAGVDFETYCKPTYDRGPCKAYIPRWWFNVKTGQCEKFIWGGCQGNKNNHETRKDCETSCLRRLSAVEVSAEALHRRQWNETKHRPNVTSEYSAVNLKAGVDFETYCRPTYDRGPCKAHIPKWWFNVKTGQCEQFLYGGCQGNKNNYESRQHCERSCLRRLSALEVSAEVRHKHWNGTEHRPNVTSEYSALNLEAGVEFKSYCRRQFDRGPCKAHVPRWWFSMRTGQCGQFIYGGCQGNKNNFETKKACERSCLRRVSALEVSAEVHHKHWNGTEHRPNVTSEYSALNLEAGVDFETYCRPTYDRGPCKAHVPRWWFNVKTGQCEKFVYGGCQGNKNNYQTRRDCETSCLRRLSALEVSAEVHHKHWNGTEHRPNVTSEYSAVNLEAGVDFETYCKPEYDSGPCKAYIPRWWFNVKTGQCEQFIYGGCQGNKNNYETRKVCETSCLRRLTETEYEAACINGPCAAPATTYEQPPVG